MPIFLCFLVVKAKVSEKFMYDMKVNFKRTLKRQADNMLKENIEINKTISPNSREIEKLKYNFPQFFDKEGAFLFDRFKAMLNQSDITLNKEGYELKFLGKSYARYLSSIKTETFIAPHQEENEKRRKQG